MNRKIFVRIIFWSFSFLGFAHAQNNKNNDYYNYNYDNGRTKRNDSSSKTNNNNNSNDTSVRVSPECAAVLLVSGGAVGGAAAYAITPTLLGYLGFTQIGVAGSSFASWWQSAMQTTITSGSVFATLQSIAMAGAGPGIIQLGSSVGAATSAMFIKEICTRVDNVDPNSMAAKSITTALTVVQKSDDVKSYISKSKQWLGRMLEEFGKNLQSNS